jgi:basic amino acid/polyamine antiporter, APA family
MVELQKRLRTYDGLAVVVGIMLGSGIFRTPGLVAAQLGRPGLTFVAWILGGGVGLLGALLFAELSTRHPRAGGKYVYAREAFGLRVAFVIGWIEALIYFCAIAAIGVVSGEYLARLLGASPDNARLLGALLVGAFTGLNLLGVAVGTSVQNVATGAKVIALGVVVVVAFFAGEGAGWTGALPSAPTGLAAFGALALAFQSVIWTYYGYPDAAKIAEEVVEPGRTLPRIFLVAILGVTALYLLLNAAFLQVLPFERIASSTLVAGDVMQEIFGARAGAVMSGLALLVVLAAVNGNLFVTPRVVFALSRDGLAPAALARVNRGGTPSTAMVLTGVAAAALAASGTFERLLALAITFVLVTDGFMVLVLLRLRARKSDAPFRMPGYPVTPLLFLAIYGVLFLTAAVQQPGVTAVALGTMAVAYALAWTVRASRTT